MTINWRRSDNAINNINTFVDGVLWGGDHPWDEFIGALHEGPVHFPNHQRATLVEEHAAHWSDEPGESWFVFEMHTWGGAPNKFYKRTTSVNSFGCTEHGETIEVTPTPVQRTDWTPA